MIKRYDSYKDSRVEWIGEIPSTWNLNKVGNNTYVKGRIGWKGLRSEDFKEKGPFLITGTDFRKNGTIDWENMYHVDQWRYDEDPFIQLQDNDVLITKDGTIGKVVYVGNLKGQTCLNSGIFLTRPTNNEYHSRFFFWVLNSNVFEVFVDYNSGGSTIQHLYQNVFVNFKFPIPPLSEQQQIVSFLDTKTSLIDSLIEKTQRKIELLKEKRTSLINEVVTKGLNPNVELKDSGVEWIGEIPFHWGIGKLYQYSEMSNGSTPSRVKPEYWENGTIPWMSSGEINKKKIRDIDGRITQEGFENSSTKILPIGTVMMGLNGQGKTKGTVGILEIETTCNQSLCGMIFKDNMYPMFSYYFLDSQYYHIRGLVGEGQREGISVSFLGRYPLVVPPISEQQQIVKYLDEQTELIDNTISIEEKRIELLKEYRQSLISEVVTGKLKVTTDE